MAKGDEQNEGESGVEVVADATNDGAFEIRVRRSTGRTAPPGERDEVDDPPATPPPTPAQAPAKGRKGSLGLAAVVTGASVVLAGGGVFLATRGDEAPRVTVDEIEIETPSGFQVFQIEPTDLPTLPPARPDAGLVLTGEPPELWRNSGVIIPDPAPPAPAEPEIDELTRERLQRVPVAPIHRQPIDDEYVRSVRNLDTQTLLNDPSRAPTPPAEPVEILDPVGTDDDYVAYDPPYEDDEDDEYDDYE